MYIKNFFRLTQWETTDLLGAVVFLLTIYFFCIFSESAGFDLPIISNLVGVVIILFIPGTLFLRIIKFDVMKNSLELMLYTLGVSLVLIMSLGFAINTLLPFVGMEQPINQSILITSLSSLIILMSYIIYLKDNDSYKTPLIELKSLISNSGIFLILLPFISIIGAYLMNYYQINLFFMVLIFLICLVALMVGFQKVLSPKMYPLAILCISLALLFHRSLISTYIWGWDLNLEYYLAQNVIQNGYWFMDFPDTYNSMLSVIMLAPSLYFYTGINLVWIFKIVYPFIFAFLPVGLYFIFKKQTNPPIAFLSVFFFISLFTFYTEMLAVARQMIAELFLVLIILLMVSKGMNMAKRSLLAILFSISLIFSHYSLSYILLFLIICSMLIIILEDQLKYIRFLVLELIPQKIFSIIPRVNNSKIHENSKIGNLTGLNHKKVTSNKQKLQDNSKFKYKLLKRIQPIYMFPREFISQIKAYGIDKKIFFAGKILVIITYLMAGKSHNSDPSTLRHQNGETNQSSPGTSRLSRIRRKIQSIKTGGLSYSLRNSQNPIPEIKRPCMDMPHFNKPQIPRPKIENPVKKLPKIEKPSLNRPEIVPTINRTKTKLGGHNSLTSRINKHKRDNSHLLFNGTLLLLFITFLFTWYIYTSSSSAMISLLNVGNDIFKNIINLMDPNASQGLNLVLAQQKSFLRSIHKYIYLSSQFFVALGLLALILNQTHLKFQKEFKSLALAAFVLLVAGVVVPFLASQLNTSRLLHISLIFLAPFLVIGIFFGLKFVRKYVKFIKPSFSLKFVSIYLVIFLLMDFGLAYEFVPHEESISISLSTTYDFPRFNDRELQSAKWLKNKYNEKGIYADKHRSAVLRSIYPYTEEVPPYSDLVEKDYYLYFGTTNIQKNGLYIYKMSGANIIQEIGYVNPSKLIDNRAKIYDNGGSFIYGIAE